MTAVCLMLWAGANGTISDAVATQVPVVLYSQTLETPVIHAGGELITSYVEKRQTSCPLTIMRTVVRESDNAIVLADSVPSGIRPMQEEPSTIRVSHRMPSEMEPGWYIYRRIVYENCGTNKHAAVPKPDLRFQVVSRWGG